MPEHDCFHCTNALKESVLTLIKWTERLSRDIGIPLGHRRPSTAAVDLTQHTTGCALAESLILTPNRVSESNHLLPCSAASLCSACRLRQQHNGASAARLSCACKESITGVQSSRGLAWLTCSCTVLALTRLADPQLSALAQDLFAARGSRPCARARSAKYHYKVLSS